MRDKSVTEKGEISCPLCTTIFDMGDTLRFGDCLV